jgi:hypothetical protein
MQIGKFDAAADRIGGCSPHKVIVVLTIAVGSLVPTALRHRFSSSVMAKSAKRGRL